jgi:hypothetical protein
MVAPWTHAPRPLQQARTLPPALLNSLLSTSAPWCVVRGAQQGAPEPRRRVRDRGFSRGLAAGVGKLPEQARAALCGVRRHRVAVTLLAKPGRLGGCWLGGCWLGGCKGGVGAGRPDSSTLHSLSGGHGGHTGGEVRRPGATGAAAAACGARVAWRTPPQRLPALATTSGQAPTWVLHPARRLPSAAAHVAAAPGRPRAPCARGRPAAAAAAPAGAAEGAGRPGGSSGRPASSTYAKLLGKFKQGHGFYFSIGTWRGLAGPMSTLDRAAHQCALLQGSSRALPQAARRPRPPPAAAPAAPAAPSATGHRGSRAGGRAQPARAQPPRRRQRGMRRGSGPRDRRSRRSGGWRRRQLRAQAARAGAKRAWGPRGRLLAGQQGRGAKPQGQGPGWRLGRRRRWPGGRARCLAWEGPRQGSQGGTRAASSQGGPTRNVRSRHRGQPAHGPQVRPPPLSRASPACARELHG